ncbi:hypothetical protein HPP92_026645 [Vanilla planifolia]|uniref:Uncharacterized protein n=1 Tax=Vanilla planifolia TaxID=51239 RepID=A0A835PC46_VANPL|nr:hypothetical protein HPP92_026645 [Vanilla planifolia]
MGSSAKKFGSVQGGRLKEKGSFGSLSRSGEGHGAGKSETMQQALRWLRAAKCLLPRRSRPPLAFAGFNDVTSRQPS